MEVEQRILGHNAKCGCSCAINYVCYITVRGLYPLLFLKNTCISNSYTICNIFKPTTIVKNDC